jgi:hypothetical protein
MASNQDKRLSKWFFAYLIGVGVMYVFIPLFSLGWWAALVLSPHVAGVVLLQGVLVERFSPKAVLFFYLAAVSLTLILMWPLWLALAI